MSVPFVLRELTIVARRRSLTSVVMLYVGLLAGFILTWGLDLPGLSGRTLYDMERLFQLGLLATLLPWTAARCCAPDLADGLVMLAVVSANRPSSIVIAKIVALAGVLALVAGAGLPAAIIAQQMSAVSMTSVLQDVATWCALALLTAAATVGWLLASHDTVIAWIGASVTTALTLGPLSRWPGDRLSGALTLVLLGAASIAWIAMWSDRSFEHCHE